MGFWSKLRDVWEGIVNPASGLPMTESGTDVAGNPFGTDITKDFMDATSHWDSFGNNDFGSSFDDSFGSSSSFRCGWDD